MEQRYNHIICDEQMRTFWAEQQIYRQQNPGFKTFTIDTPPPTVSGALHIGHIFSYTQTDIIARYKRMTGHNVWYPFGFDCNGLATERFVEKKHGTNASKIGRQAFIDLCLSTTDQMKLLFVNLWRTMGLSAELEHTYSTIDPQVQKISQESFLRLVEKNYLYRKNEPALYCTLCQTTVAQAELDDMEQTTTFYDITFQTEDNQNITIATTRPELMPSCVAVLFHPSDIRYQHLANTKAVVPVFGQAVPILADESVLPDKGSGLVMVCTFGDKTDIEWYKKHQLPYVAAFNHYGKFLPSTGVLAGLNVVQARAKMVEVLLEAGKITNQKVIQNTVNVHERCKTRIEYTVLQQWFVKLIEHKDEFLKIGDQIEWQPEHMKARYNDWVKNLSWDWCISRQRIFGIPFPVWHCNNCQATLFASYDQLPVDPQVTAYGKECHVCSSTDIRPETDVMDTWNTSSITPYICSDLYQPNQISVFENSTFVPMSMRPQAHDIIRTWAFYTIAKAWMHQNRLPWSSIVISGYVLSENKEKISKSKNNAPTEPEALLAQYAPDAIRFWTASGTLGHDIAFSPEQISIGQKLLTKLFNALKFVQMNTTGHVIVSHRPQLDTVNAWMLQSIDAALLSYHKHFKDNEFSLALQVVEKVFWSNFCDNYIEIVKDQFFNPDRYTQEQVSATRYTLVQASFKILQMYAVYIPHCTEYLYQHVLKQYVGASSIHLTQLEQGAVADKHIDEAMNLLLSIIGQVRKLKTHAQLSLKTEIQQLTIVGCLQEQHDMIIKHETILKGCLIVKVITPIFEHKPFGLVLENGFYQAAITLEND